MALEIAHSKVSGLANPADPTQVGGADWDDLHAVVPAAGTPDGKILAVVGGVLAWIDPPDSLPAGGLAGQVLVWTGGGVPGWIDFPIEIPTGGTDGQVLTWASGAWVWADLPAPPAELPAATTDGYVLTLVSGVPAWAAPTGGGGSAAISTTTTLTVGTGQTYATVQDALDYLADKSIGSGLVVLSLAAGVTTELAAIDWTHVDTSRIVIRGAATGSVTVNSVSVSATGADYLDCAFALSSTAGVAVGNYLAMRVAANGGGTHDILCSGAHEILAVDSPVSGSVVARVKTGGAQVAPSLTAPVSAVVVKSVWVTDVTLHAPQWGSSIEPALGNLTNGVVMLGTIYATTSTIYLGDCAIFASGGISLEGTANVVGNGAQLGVVFSRAALGVYNAARAGISLVTFTGANVATGAAVDAFGLVNVDIPGAVFASCDEGVVADMGARVLINTFYAADDVTTLASPALDTPGAGGALVISAG